VVRVLVAPQEFKGSLRADEAATAIASGIRAARPEWEVDAVPMSDGGPGFIDAIQAAIGGEIVAVRAHDALLRPRGCRFLWLSERGWAVVEAAEANGLVLIAPEERDACRADSYGVGEVIAAALERGPGRLVVGIGGSATTDGGHGMARALGARFRDGAGRELAPGGASLAELERLDWEPPAGLAGVEVVAATDVTNRLLGREGAAAVYGPQKGASAEDVDALEAGLARFASVVRRALGVDVATLAGGGAAGGLGAGLVAFLGARLESGFEIVAGLTGLEERVRAADIVVTGEGSFDSQSGRGKTTGRVIELARRAEKPVVVFAGRAEPGSGALTLSSLEGDERRSMAAAGELLERVASAWASSYGD
jgi:glycerate kinase